MKLLIVYHSQSGRNQALALQLYDAAKSSSAACEKTIQVTLRRAGDADASDFIDADLLVLVTPENFGNVPGGMKDFLDRIYYPAERAEAAAKPYALVLDTGNSGTGCVARIESIFKGLAAKPVQEPLIFYGEPDNTAIEKVRELAEALVYGLDMGVF